MGPQQLIIYYTLCRMDFQKRTIYYTLYRMDPQHLIIYYTLHRMDPQQRAIYYTLYRMDPQGMGYLLRFVQDGSSKNVLEKYLLHNNVKHPKFTKHALYIPP